MTTNIVYDHGFLIKIKTKKMLNNKFMEIFGDKVLIRETHYLTQSITTNEPNL